jgi:hypothetical protein
VHEQQRAAGPHLAGRLAGHVEREPEMLVDLAVRLREVDVGQASVVRAAGGDHDVVDWGWQVLEEPSEAVRVGGVECRAAEGAELSRGVLQALGIAASSGSRWIEVTSGAVLIVPASLIVIPLRSARALRRSRG